MNALKEFMAKCFNLDDCVKYSHGYHLMIELILTIIMILILTIPAWLPSILGIDS